MRAWKTSTLLLILTLTALPVLAQAGGGRGSGSVPFGSRGYAWQTDIQLAKEELKEYETGLQRMGRDEWMAEVLAWVTYDYAEDKRLAVAESYRVADLDPGKKAEIEAGETDPPTWDIAWGKKGPKAVELVLTDTDSTRVNCPLATAEQLGKGYIGVFVRDGVIVCLARGPFDDGEDGPA